jgi:hypothetical protein
VRVAAPDAEAALAYSSRRDGTQRGEHASYRQPIRFRPALTERLTHRSQATVGPTDAFGLHWRRPGNRPTVRDRKKLRRAVAAAVRRWLSANKRVK